MRAGISSENSSSRRSGISYPPLQGEGQRASRAGVGRCEAEDDPSITVIKLSIMHCPTHRLRRRPSPYQGRVL
jgi:hypothetical protein